MSTASNARKPLWPVSSLVILTGLNLLDYIDRWILAAVFTPIKEELQVSDEALGTLQTAFLWGYFLTSPIFGYLGDRLPRRWLIAAGVMVWSIGTLMCGHIGSIGAMMFFRILVGFGEASFGTISPGWIADLFSPRRRNLAISLFYLAIPVGSALGYILGGKIAALYGWRAAFLWVGYPGLFLALLLFALREPQRGACDPEPAPAPETAPKGWRTYAALLTFPRYVLVVAGYAAQTFAMGGFATWAAVFLHRTHHMSNEAASTFFGTSLVIAGLSATLIGGVLSTRWQRRTGFGYEWVLALSSLAAPPFALAVFIAPTVALSQASLAGAMFFLFLAVGPLNTLILETVPATMRASAMAGSIFAIHAFGDLWSPPLVGYLSDRWDLQRACLWVLPGALAVSAILWCGLVVRTKRERAKPQVASLKAAAAN